MNAARYERRRVHTKYVYTTTFKAGQQYWLRELSVCAVEEGSMCHYSVYTYDPAESMKPKIRSKIGQIERSNFTMFNP